MTHSLDPAATALQFRIAGAVQSVLPHGSGHINHSYCVTSIEAGVSRRYLLQKINTAVFHDPASLMENVQRVTGHVASKLGNDPDAARRVLTLVPSNEGQVWHRDASGGAWRMFHFIEHARTYDSIESPEQAFRAAQAFAGFQLLLADIPAPRLHETIPGFHDTPTRYLHLEQAIDADAEGRAAMAAPEIAFAKTRSEVCGVLLRAGLPERVTHNDTKLNNVMFDDASGQALCVVDLDTVMPGLALYDFGDMVRTATSPTEEDEPDLSKVAMQFPLFEALVRGYLGTAREFLTRAEVEHLPSAGKLIALEQGIRFLADYLSGDTYYKVADPKQNLRRCRTQFRLVQSIEEQEMRMDRLVRSI